MNAKTWVWKWAEVSGATCVLGAAICFAANERSSETRVTTALTPDSGRIVIEAHGVPPPAPVFFSASVEQAIRLSRTEYTGEIRLKIHVVQGEPEVLTLGLSGDGEVVDVAGVGLRDWAVRQGVGVAASKRFLDLHPIVAATAKEQRGVPQEFEWTVRTRVTKPTVPGTAALLLVTPGDAVGFAAKVRVQPEASVDVRVSDAAGMTPLHEDDARVAAPEFFTTGEARLEVRVVSRGAAVADAELLGAELTGRVNEAARSAEFRLRGQVRARIVGARLRLLSGAAALSEQTAGDGWHVELVATNHSLEGPAPSGPIRTSNGRHGGRPSTGASPVEDWHYELVCDRAGVLPLELRFVAAVREAGDWRALEFAMPAGTVVPLRLEGLPADVSFKNDAAVAPRTTGAQGFVGFLPADGAAAFAWKHAREAEEGALFFTSTERTEVRVGAGVLRQSSAVSIRILQGKMNTLRCRVDGPGEILGVEGANVVGWRMLPPSGDAARVLEIRFSRPIDGEAALTINSQAELGSWPARVEPLRLTPEGGVRHSGFVRVANLGAVRVEVVDTAGMMQLAPGQFPGGAVESEGNARQVFVYRFPSANYGYRVLATQIQPEVNVSMIATYELTETARVINANLELDVREAPLRDWSLRVPEDYTVVAVSGSDVADYVAESAAADGARVLRVLFGKPVEGRQLLHVRLEKNQAAGAGEWRLPALRFPDAKAVRGHIGAVAAAGYRVVPARVERLAEVPLSFFPRQTAGLQQAWRLREADWTADVRVEALGQSVQADVFHLYSLKEGVVHGSVLLNYFVVGAPASEWRVAVPPEAGNIDVVGQNVRRDWRREGDHVVVSLHQPVLGAATLLITFEQPMSARGGTIQPGSVQPLGVQSERGYVQVVSPLQVKSEIRRTEGALLKLEPGELPAEFRLLTSAPSLALYHYTARPFALELGVEWYAPGETVEQVVDFAKLSSQVSRDGQVVTEAQFFVKTRGRKALRVVLPPEVKLWETRVDGALVNAHADGEQVVVPLPVQTNPNEPVAVTLRVGQPAEGRGSAVTLAAPRAVSATTVTGEWTVRGDAGRLLVPRGGTAALAWPALTETGFEWVSLRGRNITLLLLAGVAGAVGLLRVRAGWRLPAGVCVSVLAAIGALALAMHALVERRVNLRELTFATTMVPAGDAVVLELANVSEWRAMIVGWGVVVALAGVVLLAGARRASASGWRSGMIAAGVAGIAAGMLAQRAGAALFFTAMGAGIFFGMVVPGMLRWRKERKERVGEGRSLAEPGGGAATVVSVMVVMGVLGLGGGLASEVGAAESAAGSRSYLAPALLDKPAQSIVQRWQITEKRLSAEADVTVRGGVGDSFLLLRPPAVLTEFHGEGLRVNKVERGADTVYYIAPERDGVLTARLRFEMALPEMPKEILLPTGPAAAQRVTLEMDQAGWEFVSPMAAQVEPVAGLGEGRSGATLVFAPHAAPTIGLQPKRRDVMAETTQFFAEAAQLYVPGPGVVNGFARFTLRPVQGRVTNVEVEVPAGLTVGDVKGPVGAWRFDPQRRRLQVPIEPAQAGVFRFDVETQFGAGELPFTLALEPLRVIGAAGEVGMLALAFGGDAQAEGIRPGDVSAVNVQDFDATLVPRGRDGQALATVQHVWRYGAKGGRVDLKVAAVAAEVRVNTRQVVSLDDDRMLVAADLRVAITRVGLFKLSVVVPEGLEVEAASGAALKNWTETQEQDRRILTLHLNGRTLGEQAFHLTLAGAAPTAQDAWAFPRLGVREATRQTGEAVIVPGRGIRVRAVQRERVTELDPRTVGAMQPGTLAFRLLQDDWVLNLGIETLDAWVTVQALQEITLREGQTLTRIAARYRVENAAVKSVQVRLPGLSPEAVSTVRATGAAVSDIVRLGETGDTWEIRFQRGIAGETDVQIEFQAPAAGGRAREAVAPPEFTGARQAVQFVALRSGGRLELEPGDLPRGWTRVDWSAVPASLQQRGDRTAPAFCFRVAEPEGALALAVRRHDVAEALKLRVTQGELTTLFAPTGAFVTAVELRIDVLEKGTLRVRLPEGARLFNTFVNGESVTVVREGEAWLFHVTPENADARVAAVKLVYAAIAPKGGDIELTGPSLSAPVENATWRVVLPPGYELDDYRGGLRLRGERFAAAFGLEDYQAVVSSKRSAEAKESLALLQDASSWLQQGEQEKAAAALSRVSSANALDDAANEDARVQLRNLKTQQTVLSLNTRRQRLYLDNRADAARNEQLEQAATLNPFMQGKVNFDPQQVDQLLMGNTLEENTALRGIAARIVDQQLGAEPAPGAVDVTLPERGRVFVFTRSLQVDGGAPLELALDVEKSSRANAGVVGLVLGAVGVLAAWRPRRAAA